MSIRTLGDVVTRSPPPLTLPETATVFSLATALSRARSDAAAILSVDSNKLAGIATSRDVTKCVARAEALHRLPVASIMTPHPVTLPPSETPTNALLLMREGGFRHLPVVAPDDHRLLGVVDVLHLVYDAVAALQKVADLIPSRRVFEFMRAARETMARPTLGPLVKDNPVAALHPHESVAAACEALVRARVAAVVVVDRQHTLQGIFTCRDVVSRVVVPGLDPTITKLADVMTPNPDCASAEFTVLHSLQRMQACGYRHLPVVAPGTRIVIGLCDVLQLTTSSIMEMSNVEPVGPKQTSSWGVTSIFNSLFSSSYREQPEQFAPQAPARVSFKPSIGPSEALPRTHPLSTTRRQYSNMSSTMSSVTSYRGIQGDVALASFKFKDLNHEYRRIKMPMPPAPGAFDQFVVDIRRRFAGSANVGPIKIKYVDEDGDEVLLSNDEDLASCYEDFLESKNRTIHLRVYDTERPTSSNLQSPISSNASSMLGSPRPRALPANPSQLDYKQDLLSSETPLVQDKASPAAAQIPEMKQAPITPSMRKASEAQEKMMDGKMEDAIALYNKAIQQDPENARARGGRGAAHLISGDSTGAEEDYRKALDLLEKGKGGNVGDITFQMCIVGLVESLIDQRRYEEAAQVSTSIDSKIDNPGCIDAFRDELDSAGNAARQALEAGEFGVAMSCYSNALRVESAYLQLVEDERGTAGLRLGRAKCYKALEDFDMALEDYEAAALLEPESVAAHKGSGKCLAELEQLDRALEAYERAHKLDPADEDVNKEMQLIRVMLPDPLQSKKEEIAKLGALLGGMNLPGKQD
ncbi:TPR repeat-containing protein [Chondrus crispus]|uniref:TPR repeat-containing protein n=1 Tax=Chondrus crispus TaxID=2769 RepID=R7QPC9_CHOCR|nr:TPR repeat-containing protein [Chondrus crispus]CDF40347.1 TPR repeat-containing protein [Chondrus crispus]|eukprot:XP_005710641.1 TPR repeat-containing protein [Chondrus crispus]